MQRGAGDPGRWGMEDVGVVVRAGVADAQHLRARRKRDRGGSRIGRGTARKFTLEREQKANGERSWPVEVSRGSRGVDGVDDEAVLVRAHPALAAGSSTAGCGLRSAAGEGNGDAGQSNRIGNRELSGDAVAARDTHNNSNNNAYCVFCTILLRDHRAAKRWQDRERGWSDKHGQPADLGTVAVWMAVVVRCLRQESSHGQTDSLHASYGAAGIHSSLLPTAHLLHPSRCVPPQAGGAVGEWVRLFEGPAARGERGAEALETPACGPQCKGEGQGCLSEGA